LALLELLQHIVRTIIIMLVHAAIQLLIGSLRVVSAIFSPRVLEPNLIDYDECYQEKWEKNQGSR